MKHKTKIRSVEKRGKSGAFFEGNSNQSVFLFPHLADRGMEFCKVSEESNGKLTIGATVIGFHQVSMYGKKIGAYVQLDAKQERRLLKFLIRRAEERGEGQWLS